MRRGAAEGQLSVLSRRGDDHRRGSPIGRDRAGHIRRHCVPRDGDAPRVRIAVVHEQGVRSRVRKDGRVEEPGDDPDRHRGERRTVRFLQGNRSQGTCADDHARAIVDRPGERQLAVLSGHRRRDRHPGRAIADRRRVVGRHVVEGQRCGTGAAPDRGRPGTGTSPSPAAGAAPSASCRVPSSG